MQPHLLGIPGGVGETPAASVLLTIDFSLGSGSIVTAIGLLYRAAWSRILALLMAGGAVPIGLLYLTLAVLFLVATSQQADERGANVLRSVMTTVFFLGYTTWTFIVLLNPPRVEEFR